jgi:ATP-dependent Clp protease adaptor protein ClpS
MAENEKQPSDPTGSAKEHKPSRKKPRRARLPLYNVVLMNDEEHSHEYVVEMLQSIFAYPPETGFQLADEVDRRGRVIVFTGHHELAELKKEQIDDFGSDPRIEECEGSMTAVIEPADGD